jgi:hypothetical protein
MHSNITLRTSPVFFFAICKLAKNQIDKEQYPHTSVVIRDAGDASVSPADLFSF